MTATQPTLLPELDTPVVRTHPPIPSEPSLTLVLLNFNGGPWLEKCLTSIREQTAFDRIEVLVADSASDDGSERLAEGLIRDWPRAQVRRLGANLGYSAGNNRAAEQAQGRYLLFLNTDTWLEPDCVERLIAALESGCATAATPLVMDYADDTPQFASYAGFDVFGLLSPQRLDLGACKKARAKPSAIANPAGIENGSGTLSDGHGSARSRELFVAGGCSLLIRTDWFRRLGGFDSQFFMYADEYDLCWRLWAAGGRVVFAPDARLHHRSAAVVNPRGGQRLEEIRTSDTKRYYANRNNLLVLLKNSQHLLLALVPLQIMLLAAEALFMGVLARRWSHFRRGYIAAVADCWKMRHHIVAERRRLSALRQHGDVWMLRFLRGRLNRWSELSRCFRLGLPRVDAK